MKKEIKEACGVENEIGGTKAINSSKNSSRK